VHAGKTTVVAEAAVINHNGKLVAKAGGTFYIKRSSDE
jgi:acyl-coenzyme A thioesterase PaaI-like protein